MIADQDPHVLATACMDGLFDDRTASILRDLVSVASAII